MACELHCNGRARVARSMGAARKWLIYLDLWAPGANVGWLGLHWVAATVLTLCQHSGGATRCFRLGAGIWCLGLEVNAGIRPRLCGNAFCLRLISAFRGQVSDGLLSNAFDAPARSREAPEGSCRPILAAKRAHVPANLIALMAPANPKMEITRRRL